ncbi:hypothetical protein BH11ACT2_BH11ACT2_00190 [soil metagenome]
MIGSLSPDAPQCSRSGCRVEPVWNVNWRNPKLHTVDRVKVWVSCEQHRGFFVDYFENRGFPVSITPFGVAVEAVGTDTP